MEIYKDFNVNGKEYFSQRKKATIVWDTLCNCSSVAVSVYHETVSKY